jgi:pilus assembly protein CpaE
VTAVKRESGQASVELVATLPALLLLALIGVQLAIVGYGLWTAANAARAGARAAYVGGRAGEAARSAVPRPLRRGARVDDGGPVEVSLRVPSLLPGAGPIPVRARTRLGPGGGSGG